MCLPALCLLRPAELVSDIPTHIVFVQTAAVRDPGATNGEGRLTMGDTHASDAFSFLPPGQPADGAGECLVGRGVHFTARAAPVSMQAQLCDVGLSISAKSLLWCEVRLSRQAACHAYRPACLPTLCSAHH